MENTRKPNSLKKSYWKRNFQLVKTKIRLIKFDYVFFGSRQILSTIDNYKISEKYNGKEISTKDCTLCNVFIDKTKRIEMLSSNIFPYFSSIDKNESHNHCYNSDNYNSVIDKMTMTLYNV